MNYMRYTVCGILMMLPILLSAQKYKVTGVVIDSTTKKPLSAIVFIGNTTKGCLTDSSGNFLIDQVEEANFDLVVVPRNYETAVFRYTPEQREKKIRFELNVKPGRSNFLKEVVVENSDTAKLRNAFLAEFIGNSPNADECNIVNPKVLRFQFDPSLNIWLVTSTEPLQVFNESLGYKIVSQLDECYMTANRRILSCTANSWFIKSTTKSKEIASKWEINRIIAFKGSLLHFMQAFYAGRVLEEGFSIRPMQRVYEQQDKEAYLKEKNTNGNFSGWEPNPAGKGEAFLNYVDVVSKTLVPLNKIRIVDTTHQNILLSYSPQRLQVLYRFPLRLYENTSSGWNPVSYIQMHDNNKVHIEYDGMYFEPDNITFTGYWNWLKVADQLPYDYVLPRK